MNQLFVHPYLDEDVSVLVAKLLQSRGFLVTTTTEAGQRGKTDLEQLEYATAHDMAIVTHNRADFEALAKDYFDQGKTHAGVIIAVRRTPQEIARRILAILDAVTAEEMAGEVRYI